MFCAYAHKPLIVEKSDYDVFIDPRPRISVNITQKKMSLVSTQIPIQINQRSMECHGFPC